MVKRKRQAAPESEVSQKPQDLKKIKPNVASTTVKSQAATNPAKSNGTGKKPTTTTTTTTTTTARSTSPITIQIVAGSYDRVLHGVTATITPSNTNDTPSLSFADSFLFNAHTSAIRCLALSPPSAAVPGQSQKVMLASGSTDERINVYNLSAHPPSTKTSPDQELMSTIAKRPILENSKNKELGTLLHHSSTVTKVVFPTRSKLLSSSEDSTIAVTRTRDWSLLSNIKAPVPNVFGRPSGDTAPMGGTPSGVNDFAVHPSMKVMISVSKSERCMRLWNLVTGKKAGVLEFGRDVLQEIGEGRRSTGEGRKVVWGSNDESGDEFAVGFDRDILVFGMDSKVRCRVMPDARTKLHEFCYVRLDADSEATVLAVSTEDGRILFYSTKVDDLEDPEKDMKLPRAKLLAQIGGKAAGVSGRVKDFKVVKAEDATGVWYIASASSDGTLRVWELTREELAPKKGKEAPQAGKLLGTYETQNRITCMEAFVMIPRPEGVEESEDEQESEEASDDSDEE
ncbi:Protein mak11 [Cytospora paraplurivora]|uniref:Protein mak11 n=1 Tax=Cytospora paraplurivora TaxID=2898453 RepID=A0AAN9YER3_9PEZI